MQRSSKEKSPDQLAGGIRALVNVHSYEEFEMNLNAIENSKQEDHASKGRRGFMKRLGATLGAGIAAAAPAQAVDTSAFVTPPPYDHVKMRSEYDQQILAHMCMTVELMREWFRLNEYELRVAGIDLHAKLSDFTFEAKSSARALAKSAGITLDQAYIAARVAEFQADAIGGVA